METRFFTTPSGRYSPCRRQSPEARPGLLQLLLASCGGHYGRRCGDRLGFLLRWRDSRWLYLTLAILSLCTADAVLTLNILYFGGVELNSFMAVLIDTDVQLFAATKMALTGSCLVVLVANNKLPLVGGFNIGHLLRALLQCYLLLIAYEVLLLIRLITA